MSRASLIILITVIILSGCAKKSDNPAITKPDTIATAPSDGSLSYLALGDSYTVGQSVPPNASFPAQLTSQLNYQLYPVKPPTIIAITGWTSSNLIYGIAHSNYVHTKFDFVTLLIGVNDQFLNISETTYRSNFVTLLHTAINSAKGDSTRVFVLSIPDYGVTPFAMGRDSVIGPQIDQFNAINKQESLKAGVSYLDITGISRLAATDTTLIASDGLHPSGKMYTLWVQQLEPMVLARLKQ